MEGSPPNALERALSHCQRGQFSEAEKICRDLLRTDPRDFGGLHLLGLVKLQQGQPNEAIGWLEAAVKADSQSDAAFANYGMALASLGRFNDALTSYQRALAINPRNFDALRSLGDVLCDLGRLDEALASYSAALAINAADVAAWVNRGMVLRDIGRPVDALVDFDKAIAIDPKDVVVWNNRGVLLQQLDREEEALANYDRALALWPDYVDALMNRGNVLLALKRPAEALASYGRVLAKEPDLIGAHMSRGHALADLNRFDEALASYNQVLERKPDHVDAIDSRIRVFKKLERNREELAEYERLRALAPDFPPLASDIVHAHASACHWAELAQLEQALSKKVAACEPVVDPFTFILCSNSPQQQLACARSYLSSKKITAVQRDWKTSDFTFDRIRVAYISSHFRRHATAYIMGELFELHDRRRFEIIGISFGPDDKSAIRGRLMKAFDRFFDVSTRSNADVARLLRDLRVHIAVDLKGHTTDARMGILAQGAAPIQVNYMGFPGTTGADFIDYVIADAIVAPTEHEQFFSERIVHLPQTYWVNDSKRHMGAVPTRRDLGLPETAFVFCCFNNAWKINPRIFDVWARLLGNVDGSVLWLYRSNELAITNLKREAYARGIDPDRLIFAPYMDVADHLARLTCADLVLDTLPYNAHTTASDALWAGVPVVTCIGDTFAARVGASLLHAASLPELVTKNLDEYESLALQLATDRELMASIRHKLAASRATCALFDTDQFRRHMEAAYETMVGIWRSGKRPRSFYVGQGS
jgi:protein O-GlcNAc transferase